MTRQQRRLPNKIYHSIIKPQRRLVDAALLAKVACRGCNSSTMEEIWELVEKQREILRKKLSPSDAWDAIKYCNRQDFDIVKSVADRNPHLEDEIFELMNLESLLHQEIAIQEARKRMAPIRSIYNFICNPAGYFR